MTKKDKAGYGIIKKTEMCAVRLCKDISFRVLALRHINKTKQVKNRINSASLSIMERKKLLYLSKYGNKYIDYINDYLCTDIEIVKNNDFVPDKVTLVCVIKNDLIRLKMQLKYYRQKGIEQFVFLDDNSDDGTFQHLMQQPDTLVIKSKLSYTTVRRQVWINKIFDILGYNRWYLVVDSDELYSFSDNIHCSIENYVSKLVKKRRNCSKAILLDMFSKGSLFAKEPLDGDAIQELYSFYYPRYYFVKSAYDITIKGGARELISKGTKMDNTPVVSKYPLIYVKSNTIAINSHHVIPAKQNEGVFADSVLLHYKFLVTDMVKYKKRVENKSFHNGSSEYQSYLSLDDDYYVKHISRKLCKYDGICSLSELHVWKSLR